MSSWQVWSTLDVCVCVSCSVMSDSCNPKDFSPPYSSDHGIFQVRILEWVPIPFSSYFGYHTENSLLFIMFLKIYFYYWLLGLYLQSEVFLTSFLKSFSQNTTVRAGKCFFGPNCCAQGSGNYIQHATLPCLPPMSMVDIAHLSWSCFLPSMLATRDYSLFVALGSHC